MVRIMEFLDEAGTSENYAFLDDDPRAAVKKAFDLGLECILKCQIGVDDTRWLAAFERPEVLF